MHYEFEESEYSEPEELHARYHIRFDDDFRMESGGGVRTGRVGGRRSDGSNGRSGRVFFHPTGDQERPVQLAIYLYHADMNGPYGELRSWTGSDAGKLETETWYQIDNCVKLSTPGENDGVLEGWVGGNVVLELSTLEFRDTPSLQMGEYWFDCYWGGSRRSPEDNHVYFDALLLFSGLREPSDGTETIAG